MFRSAESVLLLNVATICGAPPPRIREHDPTAHSRSALFSFPDCLGQPHNTLIKPALSANCPACTVTHVFACARTVTAHSLSIALSTDSNCAFIEHCIEHDADGCKIIDPPSSWTARQTFASGRLLYRGAD